MLADIDIDSIDSLPGNEETMVEIAKSTIHMLCADWREWRRLYFDVCGERDFTRGALNTEHKRSEELTEQVAASTTELLASAKRITELSVECNRLTKECDALKRDMVVPHWIRLQVAALTKERDEAQRYGFDLGEKYKALSDKLSQYEDGRWYSAETMQAVAKERDDAQAVLRDCWRAFDKVFGDGTEGKYLMDRARELGFVAHVAKKY